MLKKIALEALELREEISGLVDQAQESICGCFSGSLAEVVGV